MEIPLIHNVINSRYFVWLLLALPSLPMLAALVTGPPDNGGEPIAHRLLHPTGEFAARFMIIAMIITPMRMIFPVSRFWQWMGRRRRYFGVAAFCYALAHTVLYIVDMGSLNAALAEFWILGIWTGWLAFAIFVPLAVTSNDRAVATMGQTWKQLQRLLYVAAIATLIHWIFVHNNLGPALVHFIPLAALEGYRIFRYFKPSKRRQLA